MFFFIVIVLQVRPRLALPNLVKEIAILECIGRHRLNTVHCRYNTVNFLTNIHKIHPIARPLVSFVDPASDWYSASVPVIIYVISYNFGPHDNDTRLYHTHHIRASYGVSIVSILSIFQVRPRLACTWWWGLSREPRQGQQGEKLTGSLGDQESIGWPTLGPTSRPVALPAALTPVTAAESGHPLATSSSYF